MIKLKFLLLTLLIPFRIYAFNADYFPMDKVKKEIERQLSLSPIQINQNDVIGIDDSILNIYWDDFHFFKITFYNGHHYSYNFGKINCVIAAKKSSEEIRVLFPLDYNKTRNKFYRLFVTDVKDGDREAVCNSLADLFSWINFNHLRNCDRERLRQTHQLEFDGKTHLVCNKWRVNCSSDIYIDTLTTYFIFNRKRLKKIKLTDEKNAC